MKKIGRFDFTGQVSNLKWVFPFLALFFGLCAFSQTRVEIEMNPSDGVVQVGERLEIYLNVISSKRFDAEIAPPKLPPQLTLLDSSSNGQSFASQASMINGRLETKVTASQAFRFLISADEVGRVQFPSLQVNVDGEIISSSPLTIQITEKTNAPSAKPNRQNPNRGNPRNLDPFGGEDETDTFSQLLREQEKMMDEMRRQMGIGGGLGNPPGGSGVFGQGGIPEKQISNVNPRDAFFVHLEVSKEEVFEGEQITANWYLYARNPIVSLDRVKFPDLKGFWKEIIQEIPQLNFTPELVNGQMYQKALLASHALFPIKAGQAVIDDFKIKAKTRSNSVFNGGVTESTRASKRLVIKVLPLPLDSRPASFSGAVGQFQIQTNLDGLSFPAGQPFTLRLRFEGQGNAKLIELPPITWPDGFEIFDTKSDARFSVDGTSYKEFEILVIPKNEGNFEIPRITFSYFDPNLQTYDSKTTEAIPIEITKAQPNQSNTRSKKESTSEPALEPQPILIWPESKVMGVIGFIFGKSDSVSTWKEVKWEVFATVGTSTALILFVFGFLDFLKVRRRPTLKEQLKIRFALIDRASAAKDEKSTTTQSINLIYLLLASMAQEKSANQEWSALIEKVPLNLREKFERPLSDHFEYFQLVGFAPEGARLEALKTKPLASQVQDLKRVSTEIIDALPREQT